MKKYLFTVLFISIIACTNNKGVYWCGDHPCINNKEKEAYFKKTMIVEVRNFDKSKLKKDSEIEKLLNQAKLDEKKRILSEKELSKQIKLEEKRIRQEEKELEKKIKLEEKRMKKEEKELSKQIKLEEKRRKQEEKANKLSKKDNKNNHIKLEKIKKVTKKKINKEEKLDIVTSSENVEISTRKFDDLVKKIIERNSSRSYPEINDIQK